MLDERTRMCASFTVYMNDVPKENGGATLIRDQGDKIAVQPTRGTAFLIDIEHGPLHCGAPLVKAILRTDIVCVLKHPHDEAVWGQLCQLHKEAEKADENSVEIWERVFALEEKLDQLAVRNGNNVVT